MTTTLTAESELVELRERIGQLDRHLLTLLAQRHDAATRVGEAKRAAGRALFDARRETDHLSDLQACAEALDLPQRLIRELYDVIARHGLACQLGLGQAAHACRTPPDSEGFRLTRWEPGRDQTLVRVGEAVFGGPRLEIIAGPCAVETPEQVAQAADFCRALGVRVMRGGAFKPRTSPYDFQGHGLAALRWLADAANARGMAVVTEVVDAADADAVAEHAQMLQIGARNMQNVPLLRACARTGRAILLKRGAGATVREWLSAAEYVLLAGNPQVVLCERGIRTFERETRNTLDVAAVALARELSHLPVIADPSHAAGRRDLILPLARAAHGAGAHGLIVEAHPCPDQALSDSRQQLAPEALRELMDALQGVACV